MKRNEAPAIHVDSVVLTNSDDYRDVSDIVESDDVTDNVCNGVSDYECNTYGKYDQVLS